MTFRSALKLLFFVWPVGFFTPARLQESGTGTPVVSTHLPVIAVNTQGLEIVDEPKITARMGILNNPNGALNELFASFSQYTLTIGIELRGESSQYFYPKKSYLFETREVTGENLNIEILGLARENDWILYGPYGDKTLIRNALIYDLAREMMHWAPRHVFCNLVINNQDQGIYLLLENIKRDKNRVDIAKLVEKDTISDDLTGGYILKIDKGDRNMINGWYSGFRPTPTSYQRIYFQYHYPEPDKILMGQKSYIQYFMNAFEASLYGGAFIDPVYGYKPYIDMNSFIDFFIINEISRNVDGYRLSTYLHKDKDSNDPRLRMGPVWDFNLGFGNANYCNAFSVVGWAYQHNTTCPNDYWSVPFWWERLMEDPGFIDALKTRWTSLREGLLHQDSIYARIDAYQSTLQSSLARNFNLWPVFGQWIWPNYYVGHSYDNEIEYLKTWIANRIQWMDANLPGKVLTGETQFRWQADQDFLVYPNPVIDYLNIERSGAAVSSWLMIRLHTMDGRIIRTSEMSDDHQMISMKDLPGGLYFMTILGPSGSVIFQQKLMKTD